MADSHHFAATLEWTGSWQGPTTDYSSYSREYTIRMEGKPDLVGCSAPIFRGDGPLHNPEDLLVASLSSCHMLSYLALCARQRICVESYTDQATARMEVKNGILRFVEALLHPDVTVANDPEQAIRLHELAHHQCFIAASLNFPIICRPRVTLSSSKTANGVTAR